MVECKVNEFGDKYRYTNGKLHREDGPAIEFMNGDKEWWVNGERHLIDDYCIKLYGSIDHPKSIMLQVKYG